MPSELVVPEEFEERISRVRRLPPLKQMIRSTRFVARGQYNTASRPPVFSPMNSSQKPNLLHPTSACWASPLPQSSLPVATRHVHFRFRQSPKGARKLHGVLKTPLLYQPLPDRAKKKSRR
ncbi:hypothetical protein ElyMa_005524500 [Elysia marginata]|uniref:Uncharacterized protein n=1 Tax=Elysia marginata TaxID=1093978 RepID=A0AAV4EW23_9GAST|nr:hypothetical protein ElyMa_005524500 [Elysia marginata]